MCYVFCRFTNAYTAARPGNATQALFFHRLRLNSWRMGWAGKLHTKLQNSVHSLPHSLSLPTSHTSLPHPLPHSLHTSLPPSLHTSLHTSLPITPCLTLPSLFQKIAGRNGVQFQIAIPGRRSYKRRSWQGQTNPYLTPYITPYLTPYVIP